MITASAPGKLVIAGEWSVLHPGNLAIVTAIDRRASVTLTPDNSSEMKLIAPDYQLEAVGSIEPTQIHFENHNKELKFLISAIKTVHSYKAFTSGFTLITNSSQCMMAVEGQSIKVGFGSSAAITVATIAACLKFLNYDYNKEELFKLASLAHFNAQGRIGSCFDIAAAVYGRTFCYSRFDPDWLAQKLNEITLPELIKADWKDFSYQELKKLENLEMLIAFTGESADTRELVCAMRSYESNHPQDLKKIYDKINKNTQKVIKAWQEDSPRKLMKLINLNQTLLIELSRKTGIGIATPKLQKIADIAVINHSAGKLSGAGGGDCGIIFAIEDHIEQIHLDIENSFLREINASTHAIGHTLS